jgi:TonB family protein
MPPIAKENDLLTATPDARPTTNAAATAEPVNKPQPVALEVPVTVNGARAVEGSDKREPFSETTTTVLIFGNGGVIRLSSSVAPGQLLFLTNERTKKEVVCQVVKSKNYRNVSGYVELEFTEPVIGFWGMRFPGDRLGPAQAAAPQAVPAGPTAVGGTPLASKPAAPVVVAKEPEPKHSQAKVAVPAPQDTEIPAPWKVRAPVATIPVAPAPPIVPAVPVSSKPHTVVESISEKPVEPFPAFDLPRTSDVKASIFAPPPQASASPSAFSPVSSPSMQEAQPATPPSQAPHAPAASDPETEALKLHTARLQEELSSLLFQKPEEVKPAPVTPSMDKQTVVGVAAKVLEFAQSEPSPAPVKPAEPAKLAPPPSKSSLGDEELKIPAWLEPLARNAAAPVSTQELIEREKAKRLAEKTNVEESITEAAPIVEEESVPELQVPSFGSALPIDDTSPALESEPRSSGKGLWIAAIAAGVLLLAAGGWWFANRQTISAPSSAASADTRPAQASVPSTATQSQPRLDAQAQVPAISPVQSNPAPQSTAFSLTNPGSNSSGVASASSPTAPVRNQQATKNSQNDGATVVTASAVEPVPAEPKKPALGEVRLASPVVKKPGKAQDSTDADPGLTLNADQPETTDAPLAAGLAVASKGPAAPATPLPIGGDVVQARLVSSVAPVYPQLAKNQHVSGDVRVDALIDADGRVTTMKIVSGPTLLHQAAMDSLKQWKYKPAALDGKPVPMHLTVTIQFRLQ